MGRLGKKLLGAAGGILAGELAKSKLAQQAFSHGIGNRKLVTGGGRKLGEKLGEYIPFAKGGLVVVVKPRRKASGRKSRKSKK